MHARTFRFYKFMEAKSIVIRRAPRVKEVATLFRKLMYSRMCMPDLSGQVRPWLIFKISLL